MTKDEMSNEFDILYNQVNSNTAPGIDEYEKSVFLTKGQDEVVRAYFDPRGNKFQAGFNVNDVFGQIRQYDFSTLIENTVLDRINSEDYTPYDPRAITFMLPDNLFLTLNESVVEEQSGIPYIYQINPISYSDYARLMQKPYQYPPKRSVWKLITNNGSVTKQVEIEDNPQPSQIQTERGAKLHITSNVEISGTFCELIGKFIDREDVEYKVRYVKKPTPILLRDFSDDDLSIDGYRGNEEIADEDGGISCKLPEGVHHIIVQRAVELCTAIYNPQALSNLVGVGNVSETNIGIVPNNSKEKD